MGQECEWAGGGNQEVERKFGDIWWLMGNFILFEIRGSENVAEDDTVQRKHE